MRSPHCLAVLLATMTGLTVCMVVVPTRASAQITPTDAYVLRVLTIMHNYGRAIERAAQRGDVLATSRLFKGCAADLYAVPIFGVDPQVVATVRSAARTCDTMGSAVLELNDPTVPDEAKALRALELLARLVELQQQLERLGGR
ncbi:MAG: hypothetical protein RMJ19_13670 [Gemmatales bacterium]|nr:hypothetical protein [Gemmatales bacterium]MDW8176719.1 hypothetical protein [Gemmatales bacterium]